MQYEDAVLLSTPEGVELSYVLAGFASRVGAETIDGLIRGGVFLAVALLVFVVGGGNFSGAIVLIVGFALFFAYDVLFEVLGGGRTPGKRAMGLRVVLESGRPIGFGPSAVRNLLRLVDGPLTVFLAGTISVLVTERNQRLGDLAAGSIVVRDAPDTSAAPQRLHPALGQTHRLDVSAVSGEEVATVREFLVRRDSLAYRARLDLAMRLAEGLGAKVGGLPPETIMPAEQFLEEVAAAKDAAR